METLFVKLKKEKGATTKKRKGATTKKRKDATNKKKKRAPQPKKKGRHNQKKKGATTKKKKRPPQPKKKKRWGKPKTSLWVGGRGGGEGLTTSLPKPQTSLVFGREGLLPPQTQPPLLPPKPVSAAACSLRFAMLYDFTCCWVCSFDSSLPAVGYALLYFCACSWPCFFFSSFLPCSTMSAASASASSLSTSLSPTLQVDLLCCVCVTRIRSSEYRRSLCRRFWSPLALLGMVVCLFSVCDALLFVTRRFLKAAGSTSITLR